jgi:serpin B
MLHRALQIETLKSVYKNGVQYITMKKLISVCLMVLVIFFCNLAMADTDDDLKIVSQGINKFSFDLYKKLKDENKEKNLFYSPASISMALAMTYAGARGNTEKQMADVLNFTLPQDLLHSTYSKLIKNLKSAKDYELNIANALWLQKDYKYLQQFLNTIEKYYNSDLKNVDFTKAPREAAKEINMWVFIHTKGKIENIVNPDEIESNTKLILTNAIYFKGKWKYEFDKQNTEGRDFHLVNGTTKKVKMMSKYSSSSMEYGFRFNYFQNDYLQLLEMPYNGDKISMIIVLPLDNSKLKDVENMIDEKKLEEWIKESRSRKVTVYLPKFKFSQGIDLKSFLENFGIKDMFNINADFSGMTGKKDIYIDKAFHKSFVEVNEEGTEATAVTVIGAKPVSSIPVKEEIVTFNADHPFIFLIRDKETGSILFMGRVMDPSID